MLQSVELLKIVTQRVKKNYKRRWWCQIVTLCCWQCPKWHREWWWWQHREGGLWWWYYSNYFGKDSPNAILPRCQPQLSLWMSSMFTVQIRGLMHKTVCMHKGRNVHSHSFFARFIKLCLCRALFTDLNHCKKIYTHGQTWFLLFFFF